MTARRPPVPEDVLLFKGVADAQISPDGATVAFVLGDPYKLKAKYPRSNIWAVPTDGGEARQLTTGVHSDVMPRWSPDGTQLFYLRERKCLFCNDTMMEVRFELQPALRVTSGPAPLFEGSYDPFFDIVPAGPYFTADSTHFVMLTREVQRFDRLNWVLNWSTEVAQRVPVK